MLVSVLRDGLNSLACSVAADSGLSDRCRNPYGLAATPANLQEPGIVSLLMSFSVVISGTLYDSHKPRVRRCVLRESCFTTTSTGLEISNSSLSFAQVFFLLLKFYAFILD